MNHRKRSPQSMTSQVASTHQGHWRGCGKRGQSQCHNLEFEACQLGRTEVASDNRGVYCGVWQESQVLHTMTITSNRQSTPRHGGAWAKRNFHREGMKQVVPLTRGSCPIGHSRQCTAPASGLYCPFSLHSEQEFELLEPSVIPCFPAGHSVHSDWPDCAPYAPRGQGMHSDLPAPE